MPNFQGLLVEDKSTHHVPLSPGFAILGMALRARKKEKKDGGWEGNNWSQWLQSWCLCACSFLFFILSLVCILIKTAVLYVCWLVCLMLAVLPVRPLLPAESLCGISSFWPMPITASIFQGHGSAVGLLSAFQARKMPLTPQHGRLQRATIGHVGSREFVLS